MSAASRGVVVVGSANADLVARVPRRPAGGETLLGDDLQLLPGGKGANQAAAAARCGADVAFVGRVGADANGAFLRERLVDAGVDTALLGEAGRPTGTAIILLTPDGENSIIVSPGANHALDIGAVEVSHASWSAGRIVAVSLEIPQETAFHVVEGAARSGARVVLNAAPATRVPERILACCDPLIVNEHEARAALGATAEDPDAADYPRLAERLRAAGARSVVVTLGADGALVADGEGIERIPAHRVPVVDTTGAGDAFVGAVAAELAAGSGLRAAVRFAAAVAAVSVQRMGAQSSYADRAEIDAFLAAAPRRP